MSWQPSRNGATGGKPRNGKSSFGLSLKNGTTHLYLATNSQDPAPLKRPPSRGGLRRRSIIYCDSECDAEHEHTGLHCDIERRDLLDLCTSPIHK